MKLRNKKRYCNIYPKDNIIIETIFRIQLYNLIEL